MMSRPPKEEMMRRPLKGEKRSPIGEEMMSRPPKEEMMRRPLKGEEMNKIKENKTIESDEININFLEDNLITDEIEMNKIPEANISSQNVNKLCFINQNKEGDKVCLDYDKIKFIYQSGNKIDNRIDQKINEMNKDKVYEYDIYENSELINQNTLRLHDINIEDCKSICNSYNWCNSIDHHKSRNKCYLSNSKIENSSKLNKNKNFNFYQKKK